VDGVIGIGAHVIIEMLKLTKCIPFTSQRWGNRIDAIIRYDYTQL